MGKLRMRLKAFMSVCESIYALVLCTAFSLKTGTRSWAQARPEAYVSPGTRAQARARPGPSVKPGTRARARSGEKWKHLPGHGHGPVKNENIYPGTGTVRWKMKTTTRARARVPPKYQARSILRFNIEETSIFECGQICPVRHAYTMSRTTWQVFLPSSIKKRNMIKSIIVSISHIFKRSSCCIWAQYLMSTHRLLIKRKMKIIRCPFCVPYDMVQILKKIR